MPHALRRYGWLASLLLVVLLLAYLPARLLTGVLPTNVALGGVSGTIWQGRAARASVVIDENVFMLGTLDWQLHPLSLLVLSPSAHIESRWGAQRLTTDVSINWRGDVRAEHLLLTTEIGWVRQLIPFYVEGNLRAEFSAIEVQEAQLVSASGQLQWERAAWAARAGNLPLGDYVISVSPIEGGGVAGEVITLSGGLEASGALRLVGSDYTVDVSLAGPAMDNDGLRQAMALFAIPDGDRYVVTLNGRLR